MCLIVSGSGLFLGGGLAGGGEFFQLLRSAVFETIVPTFRYFTMMRDPIARKISHFGHFVLRGGNATDSMNLLSEDEKVRLYRYLLSKNRNYMTKRVGIVAAGLPEVYTSIQSLRVDISRQLAEKTLVNAKQHLIGHFFFVGLHER